MRISFEHGFFIAHVSNNSERLEVKEAGFFPCPVRKKYITSKMKNAVRLREYFDDITKKQIDVCTLKVSPWPNSVHCHPSLKAQGLELRDYQLKGVKFILDRNYSYVAFEQRLGKTATLLTGIYNLKKHYGSVKAVVVVPPNKLIDWCEDTIKWCGIEPLSIGSEKDILGFEKVSDYEIVIVSDTMIGLESFKELLKEGLDILGVDEAHRFVNETGRTSFLYGTQEDNYSSGIVRSANRVVLLSGTPIPNRPLELWPMIKSIIHSEFNYCAFETYAQKFCAARMVHIGHGKERLDATGSSNHELLKKRLSRFMVVDKLANHTSEVPKHFLVRLEGGDGKPEKLLPKNLDQHGIDEYFDRIELGDIANYRKELSTTKLEPSFKFIFKELQNTKEQFLIFGVHTDLIKDLYHTINRSGYRAGLITGQIDKNHRQQIKDKFQKGEIDCIVAQVETMVGIDLFKANKAFFVESPWSPKSIMQAALRLATVGKKEEMFVYHLVLKHSFEEYILRRALEKLESIDKVV